MTKFDLSIRDVEDVLEQDIVIGIDRATDGRPKKFCYNPWDDEYVIYKSNERVTGGNAIEELLAEYNAL